MHAPHWAGRPRAADEAVLHRRIDDTRPLIDVTKYCADRDAPLVFRCPVAEEQWSDDAHHLILDARSLRPLGELHHPGTTCLDPLALGDGTWLTIHGHTVRRRRTW